jgi:sodium-independent sulfate anion transporter 11
VILDFSSVNHADVTSIQTLLDTRKQLDRYASPDKVQWHFVQIKNRWTRRALAAAGFGYPDTDESRWKPIFSVADLGGISNADQDGSDERGAFQKGSTDPEEARKDEIREIRSRTVVVHSVNRPFFHSDLTSALQSTLKNIDAQRNVVRDAHTATALDLQEH